jgi:hypothetical protein
MCSQRFSADHFVLELDQVIPEGAGRCQGDPACSFAVVAALQGHGGMASRLLSPDRRHLVRAGGTGQGPGPVGARPRVRGAAGVLDAAVGEPIMAGQGKAADLRQGALWSYGPAPRCSLVAGQAPGCGHPFGVLAVAGRGGMGRSAAGIGINQRHGRAARGGGQTRGRSRAARVRACSPWPRPRGCGRPGT